MDNPFQAILTRIDEIERKIDLLQSCGATIRPKNDDPRIINTKELCKILNVTEPTIIRWRRKGKIPFMQIGSAVRFNLNDVLKSLEEKRIVAFFPGGEKITSLD